MERGMCPLSCTATCLLASWLWIAVIPGIWILACSDEGKQAICKVRRAWTNRSNSSFSSPEYTRVHCQFPFTALENLTHRTHLRDTSTTRPLKLEAGTIATVATMSTSKHTRERSRSGLHLLLVLISFCPTTRITFLGEWVLPFHD